MKVHHWAASFHVAELMGETDMEVAEIVSDSKKASPGSLFVALKGTRQDGHRFIPEAIARGAVAVVLEGPIPREDVKKGHPVTFIRVEDSRRALSHLASYFFENPTEALHLIGITGTNGKTTTAFLVHALLEHAGLKSGLLGTIRYNLGGRVVEAGHTTPGSLDLQRFFSEMRTADVTHVAMEVSSHALDQGRVDGCRFQTAVFTNLTQDHLDYHGTMEAYFASKQRLFDLTKGERIINIDDPWGRLLREGLSSRCWSLGIQKGADFFPRKVASGFDGIRMTVQTPLGEIEIVSQLVGRHNIYNLLAAVAVGVATGLSRETIAEGIASMPGVPGRFEKIDLGQDFSVIVDYAHTPDALARLLQAVSDISPRRMITVFGCGGDRDRGKRPQMGEISARFSNKTIITSDNPRSEPPLSIIREIEAGFRNSQGRAPATSPADYEIIPDRREAIERGISLAETGDVVVIAGKGHENYQLLGSERRPFDDREAARHALAKRFHG
ncbi:MAG: UDP-N-acetylmuramoyl-L-alanyl-D-glutamate--2,6-diaminopimelate ligase [Nitrospiria bacterium]